MSKHRVKMSKLWVRGILENLYIPMVSSKKSVKMSKCHPLTPHNYILVKMF